MADKKNSVSVNMCAFSLKHKEKGYFSILWLLIFQKIWSVVRPF